MELLLVVAVSVLSGYLVSHLWWIGPCFREAKGAQEKLLQARAYMGYVNDVSKAVNVRLEELRRKEDEAADVRGRNTPTEEESSRATRAS